MKSSDSERNGIDNGTTSFLFLFGILMVVLPFICGYSGALLTLSIVGMILGFLMVVIATILDAVILWLNIRKEELDKNNEIVEVRGFEYSGDVDDEE